MIYVFYGSNTYQIEEEIDKIKEKTDALDFFKYNLEDTNIKDIIIDASSVNLFSINKVILVENSYIFTGTTNKKLQEQDTASLEKYMQNPNPNTLLIFTIYKDKIDDRKKISKLAKNLGYLKECNNEVNSKDFIYKNLKEYDIQKEEVELLKEKTSSNLSILKKELEKLKLYKEDNKITKKDIDDVISKNLDMDIFTLIDYILKDEKQKALDMYHEMLTFGEEPIMLVVLLANQFRLLYQVKKLSQNGYTEKQIATELKVHWYPVRKALSNIRLYSDEKLLSSIHQLSILDMSMKLGEEDKNLALDFFILGL